MNTSSQQPTGEEEALKRKAARTQYLIYLLMAIFIALPFFIAVWTGAVRF